ncbi:RNA-directed DNA polymerase, eukaryota, reverse transcriptase zinc-binding domain protein [Tanacetum coccineum]|uniref:RNA-directed DNA polymerase, eukaryota, reverse transcriptase zinc-binding domain protein n=1 Tax=Tanacetum coccineum TaxID=301880 RepID=A0ABQ5F4A9_9ASTR
MGMVSRRFRIWKGRFLMNRRTEAHNGQKGKMWNEGRFGNMNNKWQQNNRFKYRRRRENQVKEKDVHGGTDKNSKINEINNKNEKANDGQKEFKDSQKVQEKGSTSKESNNEGGILGSNRFTLLDSLVNEEELVPTTNKRKIANDFLHKKCEINNMEMNDWSEEMKSYSDKQKEVKKLIQKEGLQLCAILETHVKFKNIKKTCENVFGDWEYITNGDFNVTLKVSKHSTRSANPSSEMTEFQDCINGIEVEDLHSEEFHYTWTKMRILNGVQKRKSSFRFSKFITDKDEFLPTVRSVWNKRIERHTLYKVVQKMKALKMKLKLLSCRNGNVFERAKELRKKVKESQNEVDMFPHDEKVKEKSCMILKEYQEAIQDEYSLLCQKSKVEWLKEGDRNTAYFYKTLKERVRRGRIMTIRNEEGVRFENDEVRAQIVKHFEEFLGKSSQVLNLSCRNDIFRTKLSPEEALEMVRPISDPESKKAMFEIEDSKAPGPDGYTSRFYKTAWSIVGKEIPIPGKVSDFRPIACCNVMYKCISKIMTNRLKGVLGKLVNENQSAFISGRQITNNILLAQELFRDYNRKQNVKKSSLQN